MSDNRKDVKLPWTCPDHPAARIRREWTRTQYTHGGGWRATEAGGYTMTKLYRVECKFVAYALADSERDAGILAENERLWGECDEHIEVVRCDDSPDWPIGSLVYHENVREEDIEISSVWPGGWPR